MSKKGYEAHYCRVSQNLMLFSPEKKFLTKRYIEDKSVKKVVEQLNIWRKYINKIELSTHKKERAQS